MDVSTSLICNHDIVLSVDKPEGDTNLDELYNITVNRIKIYNIISTTTMKEPEEFSDDWFKQFFLLIDREDLGFFNNVLKNPNNGNSSEQVRNRKLDLMSLHISLITFLQNKELRDWVVEMEILFYKAKYLYMSKKQKQLFLKQLNLDLDIVSPEENETVKQYFIFDNENTSIYKIKYRTYTEILKNKNTFFANGYIYFTETSIWLIVACRYRSMLFEKFYELYKKCALSFNKEIIPERLKFITEAVNNKRELLSFGEQRSFTVQQIKDSAMYYPPCMIRLHSGFTKSGHIRYQARRMYNLFLKGMGVDMRSCIEFMKKIFCTKITEDVFQRNYEYHIKHDYGRIGGRIQYNPFSCSDILKMSEKKTDMHACPFKVEPEDKLLDSLKVYNFESADIEEIMTHVNKKQCQTACSKFFMCKYKKKIEVIHPNQYFNEASSDEKKPPSEIEVTVSKLLKEMIESLTLEEVNKLENILIDVDEEMFEDIAMDAAGTSYWSDEKKPSSEIEVTVPKLSVEAIANIVNESEDNDDDSDEEMLKTIDKVEMDLEKNKIQPTAFPPCMFRTMEMMRKNNTRREYPAQRQYVLFLQRSRHDQDAINDHLKTVIGTGMSNQTFKREYTRIIKFIYEKHQSPLSCNSVCQVGPTNNLMSGCFFKSSSPFQLKNDLEKKEFPITDIEDILQDQKEQKYESCCRKYIKIKHDINLKTVHPNDYYEAVRNKIFGTM